MEMNETDATHLEDAIQQTLTPGEQLAARRQELNWTIEQVAAQLNLAPRQIQAIEADNHPALPGIASVRGFIRSYARLLRMDPAPLLQMISDAAPALHDAAPLRRALPNTTFSVSRISATEGSRLSPKVLVGVSLLVVVSAVIVAGKRLGWNSLLPQSISSRMDSGMTLFSGARQNAPATNAGSASANAQNDAAKTAAGATTQTTIVPLTIPTAASDPAPVPASVPVVSAPVVSAPVVSANAKAESAPPVSTPAAQTATASEPAAAADAGAADMLVFKLREDSWIEIRRADRSTMISRLVKAGSTESFKLTGPVSVTVGNASGVDATLRGAPLALQAEGKGNIARLKLK
jgi:cytoskeleton protein RodZ